MSQVLRGGKTYSQSVEVKQFIKERDNHACQICGAGIEARLEADHVIPYSISHDSHLGNLRTLCTKCNRATRLPRKDTNPFHSLDDWYSHIEAELSASHY